MANLAPSLVAAQSELRAIGKDSTNPDFRSQYASLDHVIASVRPILARHGLAVVQGSQETDERNMLTVETQLIHSSGEWLTTTVVMPLVGRMVKGGGRAEPDPQAGGSALSYGRRYGLVALLCLSTGEDDDGNTASRQPAPAKAAPRTPEAAPTAKKDEDKLAGGKRLGEYSSDELRKILSEKTGNEFVTLRKSINNVLANRQLA